MSPAHSEFVRALKRPERDLKQIIIRRLYNIFWKSVYTSNLRQNTVELSNSNFT